MLSRSSFSARRSILAAVAVFTLALSTFIASPAVAHPSAMKLFPQETLLLLRTPNIHEFLGKFKDTNGGRMSQDPQLKPFFQRLYGGAGDYYKQKLESVLGISWDDLQKLPQGEVAFAIVARKDHLPAFILLVDQGDAPDGIARKILDAALAKTQEGGGQVSTQKIEGTDVTVIRDDNDPGRNFGLFERDNTIVAATDPALLRHVLVHWNDDENSPAGAATAAPKDAAPANASTAGATPANEGEDATKAEPPQFSGRTLAENDHFVTVLRSCRRPQDPPPNVIIFVDPIGLLREFGRDSAGLKIAMAMFPALGIDGISAIGGTETIATDQYDALFHMHILLENPRAGVIQVINFEPGEITPQPWVPEGIETVMTSHWNVRASFNTIVALVDRFQFPGRMDKLIAEKVSEPLGIDFPKEVIDNAAGRFTWLIGYDKPAHLNGQRQVIAIELKDAAAGEKTLATVVAKFPELFEEQKFGNVKYYAMKPKWLEALPEDQRPFVPFVGILDGYFFIGGSTQIFEQAIAASQGTADRLADSKEYQAIQAQVQRETPGLTPAVWMYSDVRQTLHQWYDLLTSEKTRAALAERQGDNPFFAALVEAMDAHELPAFEVIVKYSAPSGGVIYDTDTGYHGISFGLRCEPEQ
jgi:hypothetical protein